MATLERALAADRADRAARTGPTAPTAALTVDKAVDEAVDEAADKAAAGPDGVLVAVFRATRTLEDDPLPADTYQAMLHSWIAVHGFISLEIFGHLDWMPAPARDALFEGQLHLCLTALGLPTPASS